MAFPTLASSVASRRPTVRFIARLSIVCSILAGCQDLAVPLDPVNPSELTPNTQIDNEILIWVKDATTSPRSPAHFKASVSSRLTIGLPRPAPGSSYREAAGPAQAGSVALQAVRGVLSGLGVEPYRPRLILPVYMVRVPDQALRPVLAVLLQSPYIDYIEANVSRPAEPAYSPPLGSNPTDLKHSVHNVEPVWTYTRGAGAKVGILDSGYTQDRPASTWHPDGLNLTSFGIVKKGFVDDEGCSTNYQTVGACLPYDDHYAISQDGTLYGGHGTSMAGLAGANDNNTGKVGIMPEGFTYSMKIVFNSYVDGRHCGFSPYSDYEYCIETDDFVAAVDWASSQNLDVLSMSFAGVFDSSVHDALSSAYYDHDILLLAAAGNKPDDAQDLIKQDYVMAVAAVNSSGTNLYNTAYAEVSGFAHGYTTVAYCPSKYAYCTLDYNDLRSIRRNFCGHSNGRGYCRLITGIQSQSDRSSNTDAPREHGRRKHERSQCLPRDHQ